MDKGITITLEEWREEGKKRFGDDIENWKFKCPSCGNIASCKDFEEAGAEPDDAYQCCIGRFNDKKTGCDWAAYGFFDICKVHVIAENGKHVPVFEFADGYEEGESA